MPQIRHPLKKSLILLDDYLHPLFGADGQTGSKFDNLKQKLGEVTEGYDTDGRSYIAQRLRTLYKGDLSQLETYDDNIKRHLDAINAHRPQDEQIILKYFQHLALLYTEHLLHRVYTNIEAFVDELNKLVVKRNEHERRDPFDLFTPLDLRKLAYWMATGSGKTLLMHVNYLQIGHYVAWSNHPPFENILLITPNAGLSKQHLGEFALSSIPAQLFRQGARNLSEGTVQIIEITKFTTGASGPLTVNVGHFEGRNLIFVDEGHRGASGDVWFGYRDRLAADGFTFEYSATFGQALNSGNKPIDMETRHTYGKSIAFDYSYPYFYSDGYGKDYNVQNLPHSYHEDHRDMLLLASLLTFFEQSWIYQERNTQLKSYFVERPLLMFVGHTVQAGKARRDLTLEDNASISDVLDIVRFLHRVTSDSVWAIDAIKRVLTGRSGFTDKHGVDTFLNLFTVVKGNFTAATAYNALLELVFHAESSGSLHLANLRSAAGEISLRVGSADTPFGVVNIGDDVNFLAKAETTELGLVIDSPSAINNRSLFETINDSDSKINVLVGAKKFSEGWSSWRVSGMGLLNVGRSEGSEIIQMFGRGVRLKGLQRSLKRSAALEGNHPPQLGLLETLHIFSVKGNYLEQFRDTLELEGIETYEEVYLPIQFKAFEIEKPQLYILRPKGGQEFVNQPTFRLEIGGESSVVPTIDRTPRVQVETSIHRENQLRADKSAVTISTSYLDLLDWDALYQEILAWRRQRGFLNLTVSREALRQIVEPVNGIAQWYVLYAPNQLVAPTRFADLHNLQLIVLDILKQYTERFYNHKRQQWESQTLEYKVLDDTDPNLNPTILPLDPPRPGYVVKIKSERLDLAEALEVLIKQGEQIYTQDLVEIPNIVFDRHLYTPLIAKGRYDGVSGTFIELNDIKSVPVGLNEGETRFVWRLRDYLQGQGKKILGSHKLYLLRNLSRGKGVGFFEASNFYPDFVLWVVGNDKQVVTFIDPKGLAMLRPSDFSNPKIQLFGVLRETIRPRLNKPNVILDAYIISDTEYAQTIRYFGNTATPYSREEFRDNHVLFPQTSAADLVESVLAQLK